ncbi:hypothetical protein ACH5AO_24175 [Streptomyces sp. NPDC018964]|uniref:hypothetical protein n=1 Tax=Streptomyces sp. NPDC018964 TaxID=3365058 RepID=UPI0037ADBD81
MSSTDDFSGDAAPGNDGPDPDTSYDTGTPADTADTESTFAGDDAPAGDDAFGGPAEEGPAGRADDGTPQPWRTQDTPKDPHTTPEHQPPPGQWDVGPVERLESLNGSVAYHGNAVTLNMGTPTAEFQWMDLDATETSRTWRLHEEVPDPERMAGMAERLREHHLLVLVGAKGSGREFTSCVLLAERCGSARLGVLHGDQDRLARALIERNGRRLKRGYGVRVNVGPHRPDPATLDALALRAREREAYVVVIVEDPQADLGDLGPFAVHHRRPEPLPVLKAHLRAALAEHRTQCAENCTHDDTEEFRDRAMEDPRTHRKLGAAPSVHWITRFARDLAGCLHEPEGALDALLDAPVGDLRSLVRRFLKLSEQVTDPAAAGPHHQALRIAYLLGHELPLSDVIRAGTLLGIDMLSVENRDTAPARPVFEADLDRLVPPGGGIAAEPGAGAADNPRRARLADPELMSTAVEVVWHDIPWLREPLVAWLRRLGADDLERVRARAGVIAGHLLRYDFDSVYRDLVKGWAISKSVSDRRCAALALAVALEADSPWLTDRITRQVASWADSPRWPFQDSAARAYGTSLGTRDVSATLPALQELAGRPALVPYVSVAYSLTALFLAEDGTEPVTEALGRWIRSSNDNLPRHAVRALLVLGPFAVGPELPSRPRLAQQAMDDPDQEETLLLLWQRALVDPAHSGQAWQLLQQWLLAADQDEELARFLEKFVPRVCVPRLVRRTRFHLRRCAREHPEATCVRRVLDSLDRP